MRFVLDLEIAGLRHDKDFMAKAQERFRNGYGYSKRFVYRHNVYKFCQRGDGMWLLYRENNGVEQTSLEA